MAIDAINRRRWFGGILLTAAMVMLICGQTVLQGRLDRISFLTYWLICFVLTGLAAIVAARDLRDLHQRTRREQKDLLEKTLKDIEKEARARNPSAFGED